MYIIHKIFNTWLKHMDYITTCYQLILLYIIKRYLKFLVKYTTIAMLLFYQIKINVNKNKTFFTVETYNLLITKLVWMV